ncbi:hypothetical protein L345_15887, partial [Ophiophagus hannah]
MKEGTGKEGKKEGREKREGGERGREGRKDNRKSEREGRRKGRKEGERKDPPIFQNHNLNQRLWGTCGVHAWGQTSSVKSTHQVPKRASPRMRPKCNAHMPPHMHPTPCMHTSPTYAPPMFPRHVPHSTHMCGRDLKSSCSHARREGSACHHWHHDIGSPSQL